MLTDTGAAAAAAAMPLARTLRSLRPGDDGAGFPFLVVAGRFRVQALLR